VESFKRCYGCSEEEARALTAAYREHYSKGELLHARPYDGIFELCEELKNAGFQLALATSKPQVFSEGILAHFGFDFPIMHCADLEGKLSKADLIRQCVIDSGAEMVFMIGDTKYDAKGAMEANVPFIAVTYGFGNQEEMLQYPHIAVADTPLEVLGIIMEKR
jgi:phosphoglycolate phosphatase